MAWGEAHDAGTGTTAQIEEAHRLLDEYGTPKGPLSIRVAACIEDIKTRITPVMLAIDPSWAPGGDEETRKEEYTKRMMGVLQSDPVACTIEDPPRWNCVVCEKKIHGGGEKCICSAYREKDFNFASLCFHCCEVYDKLMSDDELKRMLKHLFQKYYYSGHSSINDF